MFDRPDIPERSKRVILEGDPAEALAPRPLTHKINDCTINSSLLSLICDATKVGN